MKKVRLPQELIEQDILKATGSRECPADGRMCIKPDIKGAESDRVWAEYIQRQAEKGSCEIFSTIDRNGFVSCCNDCPTYKSYQRNQGKQKPTVQNPKHWSLMEDICGAWYLFKSRFR